MSDNDEKIQQIYDVIVGSELHPDGMISRIQELENFKSLALKAFWTGTGIALTIGTVLKLT
tara:strand:- start:845 stop:1027 length:183 start_codon:yes stop_codon:yes gene_type:complete